MINLGFALATLGELEDGVKLLQQAAQRQPANAETLTTLGVLLSLQAKWREAVALHEQAVALNPEHVRAHCNLSYALLIQGNFERGWREFDWRWKLPRAQQLPPLPQPFWDGADLDGKVILVHLEGGWGDVFQFIRYVELIAGRGGRVVVPGQKFFTPLVATCPGLERLLPAEAPWPEFSVQTSLLNLPRLLGTTVETIPARAPYLFADRELVEHWHSKLSAIRGFLVAINWQGNPQFGWDRYRSIPLGFFEPLSRVEGVRLISLQKGHGAEQLEALQDRFPVATLDPRRDETSGPFMDTAAILQNLDLLITSDTALAHLAGAMGIPVWIALSSAPDWRWLLDREDYPWYPSMRLFRQSVPGDWREVFARISRELAKLALTKSRTPLVPNSKSPA
jgi:tetratricopeptide (TPR) repeat protein